MNTPELISSEIEADGGISIVFPTFDAATVAALLNVTGDTPAGRGFIEAAASLASFEHHYHAQLKRGAVPADAAKHAKALRGGVAAVTTSLLALRGIEAMQTWLVPGGGLPSPINREHAARLFLQMDRWVAAWEPLVKRGRGRSPGTKNRSSQLTFALRALWASQFEGDALEKNQVKCNAAAYLILGAAGFDVARHAVADLGRQSGKRPGAKSKSER